MRRKSKPRGVLRWLATVCCVATLFAAILSVRIRPLVGFGYGYVLARHGNLLIVWSACDNAKRRVFVTGVELPVISPGFRLSLPTVRKLGVPMAFGAHRRWVVAMPLWLILAVAAAPAAYLWRRHRRYPKSHCQSCGYDLTGNTSGVCPECGERI